MLFFFLILNQSNILQIDLHSELHTLLKDVGIIANSMVIQIKMLMWGFQIISRIDWACHNWNVCIQPILLHYFRNWNKSIFFSKLWEKLLNQGNRYCHRYDWLDWVLQCCIIFFWNWFFVKIFAFLQQIWHLFVVIHEKIRLRWKWIFRT